MGALNLIDATNFEIFAPRTIYNESNYLYGTPPTISAFTSSAASLTLASP